MRKTIIFDLFGVISSEIAPLWFEKYFSENEPAQLKHRYFRPADLGEISEDELFNKLAALVQKTTDEIRNEFYDYVEINDDVVNLIESLGTTFKLGLCTNGVSSFVRKILESHNLMHLFDEIIISSEVGFIKPDHKIYELMLERLSTDASDSIFIDDNPENIAAAKQLGMRGILFESAKQLRKNLT